MLGTGQSMTEKGDFLSFNSPSGVADFDQEELGLALAGQFDRSLCRGRRHVERRKTDVEAIGPERDISPVAEHEKPVGVAGQPLFAGNC